MENAENSQYTIFPNISSVISTESADLSHNQKKRIFEKIRIFGSKKNLF